MGYFRDDRMKNNHPIVMLDQERIFYTIEEKRLLPHCYKEFDGKKITREYYLWATLPENWKESKRLSVWNDFPSGKEVVMHISKERLLEIEQWVPHSVDRAYRKEDGFVVEGWYLEQGGAELSFYDEKGHKLKASIKKISRSDVRRAYPDCEKKELTGFAAHFKGPMPCGIRVCFAWKHRQIEEELGLRDHTWKKVVKEGKEWCVKIGAYYRQFGLKATMIRAKEKLLHEDCSGYKQWYERHRPSADYLRRQRKEIFAYMPKISIVVPLYRTPEVYLHELIASIQNQSYTNWELCLSDGSGENSSLTEILKSYEKHDKRIRVVYNEKQLHISDNTNAALKLSTGDYIGFADHDDLLTPDALYEFVCLMNEKPEAELIYSDEDKVNADGSAYFQPHFKSDFNIDMLRNMNYICHMVIVKRSLYEKVGDLNASYDGVQDYDFVLRCAEQTREIYHISKILYHWRSHPNSTAENAANKSYIARAGVQVLEAHFQRMGMDVSVSATKVLGIYRTEYHWKEKPMISVIIPNKDHVDDLKKCMQSLERKNSYENIEYIIVENNSVEEKTSAYYEKLERRNPKVRVLHWNGKGFNYPAINEFGVREAQGEYLLFLNNDTEILNKTCMEELLSYCMREDVGAVGARLYYEDGTIQHAGVIVGLGGVAGHAFLGFPHNARGYFDRVVVAQDLSAVTAACIMVKRSVYEEVGGFEEAYAVAFNDVDLCMKIRKAGYLVVYNPYAELKHYESKSRGYDDTEEKKERFLSEVHLFKSRWKEFLEQGDPYYNVNLTLDGHDYSLNMR